MQNIQINQARLFVYNLLSLLFVEEHTKTKQDEIIKNLEILSLNSFSEVVEQSSKEILRHIEENGKNSIYEEYQSLFLVPFGDYVHLAISWYHEQREGGIMQLKVKDILAKTKIRRDEKSFTALEDNFGFVFTLSSYLLEKQISEEIKENLQKELFLEVLNPYISTFFYKLMATNSPIYSKMGLILESFCGFEKGYLEIN